MRKRVALTAAVLIGSAWPAQGYGSEDNEACASVQVLPKTRIDACTRADPRLHTIVLNQVNMEKSSLRRRARDHP
jgi:hypothetical protein